MLLRIIICFLIISGFRAKAQESLPVSIVDLAQLTLSKSPTLQSAQLTVRDAQGQYRIQKGAFDYRLFSSSAFNQNYQTLYEQDARNELTGGKLNARGVISSAGISRQFRTGLRANISADYGYAFDNLPLNRFNENVGPNISDHNFSSSLTLIQPLVKGSGKMYAAALEKSASLHLESAKTNLLYTNSLEVYELATAYWQYLLAYESALIYAENEDRVRRVLEITLDLVEGDKKPRSDLVQVRADLANQERLSAVAQQNLISSKLNLGRTIGLSEEECYQIGKPTDDFPKIQESGFDEDMDVVFFREMAHQNRRDIEANSLTKKSIEARVQLSQNAMKPQLDLSGSMNYGSMTLGNGLDRALASVTNLEGRTVGFEVGLKFEIPVSNNSAKGAYIQSLAMQKDQQIYTENLERNVDINVAIAVNEIKNTTSTLAKAEESLEYYQEAFDNEQARFRNGLTTLLNLILFQERLTFSQLEYLQAKRQFAIAIVNLRFETGTLIHSTEMMPGTPVIKKNLFYTIPKTK